MEASQTYISEKVRDADGVLINPATEEKQDTLNAIANTLQSILTTQERIASQSMQLSRTKELMCNLQNSFGAPYTTSVVNAISNPFNGTTLYKTNENFHLGNMGALQLYSNIK